MRKVPLAAALVTALAFAFLVGLGVWQLQRLAWKEAIIARIAARANAAPQPPPPRAEWAALRPDDYDYRRVRVSGRFVQGKVARVFRPSAPGGTSGEGPGYVFLAPFETKDGIVVVNRGFAPLARADDVAAPPAGETQVEGLMRPPEPRNAFTPPDTPEKGLWYTRDGPAIAAALGFAQAAPFTIDADRVPGVALPRGGATEISFPNNHLSYALTWFGLAATLLVVFGLWVRRRGASA